MLLVLVLVGAVVYGLDQLTKQLVVSNLVEGERHQVIGDILVFQFVRNPGAAFSLASGSTWIFSILATVVAVVIIVLARRIKSFAWAIVFGLLLGGVLGNLTDRLVREPSFGLGHVIDFIATPWMLPAIYNLADIAIVSSMIVFVILTLLGVGLDGRRESASRSGEQPESADTVAASGPSVAAASAETSGGPDWSDAGTAETASNGRVQKRTNDEMSND